MSGVRAKDAAPNPATAPSTIYLGPIQSAGPCIIVRRRGQIIQPPPSQACPRIVLNRIVHLIA